MVVVRANSTLRPPNSTTPTLITPTFSSLPGNLISPSKTTHSPATGTQAATLAAAMTLSSSTTTMIDLAVAALVVSTKARSDPTTTRPPSTHQPLPAGWAATSSAEQLPTWSLQFSTQPFCPLAYAWPVLLFNQAYCKPVNDFQPNYYTTAMSRREHTCRERPCTCARSAART